MRKRIYEIIEIAQTDDRVSHFYDMAMIVIILLSIIPLAMKEVPPAWVSIERVCVAIFIVDYILRLATADLKYGKASVWSFVRYPFSPMAIIDLLSILPHFLMLNHGFGLFRLVRMARAFRVLRVFRAFRYSRNFDMILSVIRRSKDSLIAVGTLTIAYVLTSALIILNVEPDSFDNYFEAVYWATVSLTTVGYGDLYPVTVIGRVVTMLSSFLGVAIVALPAGIITAGYMKELEERREDRHNH
ncbi:MAG: ion transporter [Mogibacterium sp.]|nr:ion transporter [Mogibacterium sp.]